MDQKDRPGPPAAHSSAGGGARELANDLFGGTAQGRHYLKYIVKCALPEGQTMFTMVEGKRHDFQGYLGLAPGWLDRAMTAKEQRWVSACLLAHTNFFGKHVLVSMRSTPAVVPALVSTPGEEAEFSIHEGDFFGNLFSTAPEGFVCRADRSADQERDPILQWRVCTSPAGAATTRGETPGRCGFSIIGSCSSPTGHSGRGQPYQEVISVYLKPGLSTLLKDD